MRSAKLLALLRDNAQCQPGNPRGSLAVGRSPYPSVSFSLFLRKRRTVQSLRLALLIAYSHYIKYTTEKQQRKRHIFRLFGIR